MESLSLELVLTAHPTEITRRTLIDVYKRQVHLIGRATKTKIELDRDYIDERLPVGGREMIYRQVENSFTQPNAAMNKMCIRDRVSRYPTY